MRQTDVAEGSGEVPAGTCGAAPDAASPGSGPAGTRAWHVCRRRVCDPGHPGGQCREPLPSVGGLGRLLTQRRLRTPDTANQGPARRRRSGDVGRWSRHSSSSQLSVRWPRLWRRMLTSLPAERRLQRELPPPPGPARLVYLPEPLVPSSQPGRGAWSLRGPDSAATSSRTSFGGSQPSISSGFLDCVFGFKTRLSQNPDFFSVFSSSFSRKLVLWETEALGLGDAGPQILSIL